MKYPHIHSEKALEASIHRRLMTIHMNGSQPEEIALEMLLYSIVMEPADYLTYIDEDTKDPGIWYVYNKLQAKYFRANQLNLFE